MLSWQLHWHRHQQQQQQQQQWANCSIIQRQRSCVPVHWSRPSGRHCFNECVSVIERSNHAGLDPPAAEMGYQSIRISLYWPPSNSFRLFQSESLVMNNPCTTAIQRYDATILRPIRTSRAKGPCVRLVLIGLYTSNTWWWWRRKKWK